MELRITFKAADRIARLAARKFAKRCPWASFEDLYQEAWVGILTAKNFDPKVGDRKGYLWGAAANRLQSFVTRFRLPVSGYFQVIAELAKMHAVELDERMFELSPSSEELYLRKEHRRNLRKMFEKVIGGLGQECFPVSPEDATTIAMLVISGELKAGEVSTDIFDGLVPTNQVYKFVRQARARLSESSELWLESNAG